MATLARPRRPLAPTSWSRTQIRWSGSPAPPAGDGGFCRACGSSLFFESVGGSRLTIAAGSLDQPSGLEVIGHEYVADKADYVRIADDLPARAGDWTWPESFRRHCCYLEIVGEGSSASLAVRS
jgi:hypothetical protein